MTQIKPQALRLFAGCVTESATSWHGRVQHHNGAGKPAAGRDEPDVVRLDRAAVEQDLRAVGGELCRARCALRARALVDMHALMALYMMAAYVGVAITAVLYSG